MSDRMPKIDPGKLNRVQLDFIKFIEQQNAERVQKLQRLRKNNIITGCLLGAGVLCIYGYTMLAVRQETFLDDFDEPPKITKQN